MRTLETLSPDELASHPVWRIVPRDVEGNVLLEPVTLLPVKSVEDKLVGDRVKLANGTHRWAMLGNIKPEDARLTRHFLTIAVRDHGRWFHLARYHDPERSICGPEQLAAFLNLSTDEVFPIAYDIR